MAEATSQSQADVDRVYASIIENIAAALAGGEKVELRGIGIFEVKATPARRGSNPKSGELFDIPAGRRVAFRPGSDLKKQIVAPRTEAVAATQGG